jgi:hypothetical protein
MKSQNHDEGKVPMDLLLGKMGLALKECAKVLGQGKYPKENWALSAGTHNHSEFDVKNTASKLRHMVDRSMGELRDEESGELHSAHEATRALFSVYYDLMTEETPPRDWTKIFPNLLRRDEMPEWLLDEVYERSEDDLRDRRTVNTMWDWEDHEWLFWKRFMLWQGQEIPKQEELK